MSHRRVYMAVSLIGMMGVWSQPMNCEAQTVGDPIASRSAEAMELYRQGKFEEALRIYRDALVQRPGSQRLRLNVGDALYELGDYAAAAEEFEQVAGAQDEGLAAQGYYNLGNSHFQLQDYPAAVDAYRETLKRTPQDRYAKANLELALQMLQSPPQQQQQQDGEPSESGEDQEQKEQQQDQGAENESGSSGDEEQEQQREQEQEQQQQEGEGEDEPSPPSPSPEPSEDDPSSEEEIEDQLSESSDDRMDEQEAEQLLDALGDREEEGQKRRFRVKHTGSQERDW